MEKFFTTRDNFIKIITERIGKVESLKQISTGWTNFVYKANNGEKNFVFRFPRNDFFSDVLDKEVAFSQFLKGKLSIKTADLKLEFDHNRPFTMHEELPGRDLTEAYPTLRLAEKFKIADQISNFIYELQQIDISKFNKNLS